jgi:hypothetical protein
MPLAISLPYLDLAPVPALVGHELDGAERERRGDRGAHGGGEDLRGAGLLARGEQARGADGEELAPPRRHRRPEEPDPEGQVLDERRGGGDAGDAEAPRGDVGQGEEHHRPETRRGDGVLGARGRPARPPAQRPLPPWWAFR